MAAVVTKQGEAHEMQFCVSCYSKSKQCCYVYDLWLLLSGQHRLGLMVDVIVNLNLRGDQKLYFVYSCADKD